MIDTQLFENKLALLERWLAIQITFKINRQRMSYYGIEYMGDLSQFWSFETWYKVQIGEIQLWG